MNKIIYCSIIILFCIGCNNKTTHIIEQNESLRILTLSYKEDLEALDLPDRFLDHFPDKLTSQYTFLESQLELKETSCIYCVLYEYNLNGEWLDSLEYALQNNHIAKYRADDSDLIVLKKNRVVKKSDNNNGIIPPDTEKTPRYPIPFFYEREFPKDQYYPQKEDVYANTLCGLSEMFSIYIIESKPFILKEKLPDLKDMPLGQGCGYSKGVSINKKKQAVAFWLIIW